MLLKWVHSMLSADCRLLTNTRNIPDNPQGEGEISLQNMYCTNNRQHALYLFPDCIIYYYR